VAAEDVLIEGDLTIGDIRIQENGDGNIPWISKGASRQVGLSNDDLAILQKVLSEFFHKISKVVED